MSLYSCCHCGTPLVIGPGPHHRMCEPGRWGEPHECIKAWAEINRALEHGPRRSSAHKNSKEMQIFHILRNASEPSALDELGMSPSTLGFIIHHLRDSGLNILSGWSVGRTPRFGLKVRQRVYWLDGMST